MSTIIDWRTFNVNELRVSLRPTNKGTHNVIIGYGADSASLSFITPPCITRYPRVTGDGNFTDKNPWSPDCKEKASFTLDLTCEPVNNNQNDDMLEFHKMLDSIDDKVLDFFYQNQVKLLGRRNLNRDEVNVLLIRSSKSKIDKLTGHDSYKVLNASTKKYHYDGVGNQRMREITLVDVKGKVLTDAKVLPGDVVAANVFLNQVYSGVGGDKFGCHWGIKDVCIVCQSHLLEKKSELTHMAHEGHPYAMDYTLF